MRKTKMVCTIGPACDDEETLGKMVNAGMNVARINFSHGDSDYHRMIIRRLKSLRDQMKVPLAILQDLQGPKIRIGEMDGGRAWLERDARFVLTSEPVMGTAARASVSVPSLSEYVQPGLEILLADGMIELVVESVESPDVVCRVVVGGTLSSHKGVNLRNAGMPQVESLSAKDRHDLAVGLSEGVDGVALSFVRTARDIVVLREAIGASGIDARIIAKIEKPHAVKNIDEILDAADGVMVARGDLGLEIDLAELPLVQKSIIAKANALGKPVITATQMLVRMVDNPMPTRAEVADVANAILDGTDAIMLSEETAAGQYPVEAVRMMDRIARKVEGAIVEEHFQWDFDTPSTNDAITRSSFNIARGINAAAIVTPTWSGSTPRLVSRFRPRQPIIATTPNKKTAGFLALCWGVMPVSISSAETIDDQLRLSVEAARNSGLVKDGDQIVITGGTPLHISGTTNFIKVEQVE